MDGNDGNMKRKKINLSVEILRDHNFSLISESFAFKHVTGVRHSKVRKCSFIARDENLNLEK